MEHSLQHAAWFRQVSPYINQHRGKTMLVGLTDLALQEPYFEPIVHDLVLLKSLGIKLIIVYGARCYIDEELKQLGIKNIYSQGLRVTNQQAMECVKKVVGQLRLRFEAIFSQGAAHLPSSAAFTEIISGNFVVAKPIGIKQGVDFCFTGQVRQIKENSMRQLLDLNNILLLSPIGYSSTGETFNLSFDELMVAVATKLSVDKLIIYDNLRELINAEEITSREMSVAECDVKLAELGVDQVKSKSLSLASQACRGGVSRVHLIDYTQNGALIAELFTQKGSGLLITNEPYERIMSAKIDDVGGVLELIQPLEEEGVLVRRSRERLEQEIEQFIVIKRDHAVIGCAALYPFVGEKQAEVACLTVHKDYRRCNRAAKLLTQVEKNARSQGMTRLFALTTEAIHWFNEQGFKVADVNELPVEKQQTYNFQRNSKILVKDLSEDL